ncbi:hypothetical protein ONS96_008534 [Cadophora gregata f. sp. sojae]|nr:hypothetical protein ONS96_008534 [Cadophora gregata f. sp. sojae]
MAAVVLCLTWACAIGITTTASRMTWSFARDRGTPFSQILSKVDPRTKVPIVVVGTVVGFAALLTLIYVGSETAFNDVISLAITGFYGSYFLPCAFLLHHRIGSNIAPRSFVVAHMGADISQPDREPEIEGEESRANDGDDQTAPEIDIGSSGPQLTWGPFHIPGMLGIINNAYACLYMVFVIFWSVWPPETPVDAATMNYSVLVTGGVIIFSVVWYWIKGREVYKGPVIDDEVMDNVRRKSNVPEIDTFIL